MNDDLTFISGANALCQWAVDLGDMLVILMRRKCRTDVTYLVQFITLNEFDSEVVMVSGNSIICSNSIANVGERQIDDVIDLFETGSALWLVVGAVVLLDFVSCKSSR
jgi:hypothetical protein